MLWCYYKTEKIRPLILEEFADAVHDGEYDKVPYFQWRDLRSTICASPASGDWYFMCYDEEECANTREATGSSWYILIVAPNINNTAFAFACRDGSLGEFLWEHLGMSVYANYTHIPTHIKDAIEDAHNDGIITLDYEAMPYFTPAKKITDNRMNNDKEENKTMNFNFDFGPCTHDNIRMSLYGIAVKNINGTYVSYDKTKKEIVDVDILNFDGGKYLYKIPVAIKDIKLGDVIIHNRKPVIVTACSTDIVAVDVYESEKKIVMPVKSPFGFDFCTKVISLFDMNGGFNATDNSPFGNMLPFLMLADNDKKGDNKDILLAMMMMGGGKMDFTSNPMMLYLLLGNGGSKDIDPFMMMMMLNAQGGVLPASMPNANIATTESISTSDPIVKLPD